MTGNLKVTIRTANGQTRSLRETLRNLPEKLTHTEAKRIIGLLIKKGFSHEQIRQMSFYYKTGDLEQNISGTALYALVTETAEKDFKNRPLGGVSVSTGGTIGTGETGHSGFSFGGVSGHLRYPLGKGFSFHGSLGVGNSQGLFNNGISRDGKLWNSEMQHSPLGLNLKLHVDYNLVKGLNIGVGGHVGVRELEGLPSHTRTTYAGFDRPVSVDTGTSGTQTPHPLGKYSATDPQGGILIQGGPYVRLSYDIPTGKPVIPLLSLYADFQLDFFRTFRNFGDNVSGMNVSVFGGLVLYFGHDPRVLPADPDPKKELTYRDAHYEIKNPVIKTNGKTGTLTCVLKNNEPSLTTVDITVYQKVDGTLRKVGEASAVTIKGHSQVNSKITLRKLNLKSTLGNLNLNSKEFVIKTLSRHHETARLYETPKELKQFENYGHQVQALFRKISGIPLPAFAVIHYDEKQNIIRIGGHKTEIQFEYSGIPVTTSLQSKNKELRDAIHINLDGSPRWLRLSKTHTLQGNLKGLQSTSVYYHPNKTLWKFTAAEKTIIQGRVFQAGEVVEFNKDTQLKNAPHQYTQKELRALFELDLTIAAHKRTNSPEVLKELIHNRLDLNPKNDPRESMFIFYAKYDHNGAFNSGHPLIEKNMKDFRMTYWEIDSIVDRKKKRGFLNYFLEVTRTQKPTYLVLGGHGLQTSIEFGKTGTYRELRLSHLPLLQKYRLHERLGPKPVIVLESCLTGKGGRGAHNIANMLGKIFPQATILSSRITFSTTEPVQACPNQKNCLRMDSLNKKDLYLIHPFTTPSPHVSKIRRYRYGAGQGQAAQIFLRTNLSIEGIPCLRGAVHFHRNGRLKQFTMGHGYQGSNPQLKKILPRQVVNLSLDGNPIP